MLTVALLGYGGMGRMHTNCYLALQDQVKLIAVADLLPERRQQIAEKTQAKIYNSADELLANEKPDIVDVCLPTFLHTEYAVKAMELGCNVLIEKPVCLNEEEAQQLLETEKRTGAKVQVCQVIRFRRQSQWLKKVVEEGTYGKIISGEFHRLSKNPKWGWENWFNDPERSGTAALDLHIHDADLVRYLMGDPDSISAVANRNEDGVLQQIIATYTYGDIKITAEGCWNYPDSYLFNSGYRVRLEKALVVLSGKELTVYPNEGEPFSPELPGVELPSTDVGINVSSLNGYYEEIKFFIEHILPGTAEPIAPLSEGINSVRMVWKEVELAGGKVRKA